MSRDFEPVEALLEEVLIAKKLDELD